LQHILAINLVGLQLTAIGVVLVGGREGGKAKWHCYEVVVSESGGGCKYVFPCKKWIKVSEYDYDDSEAVLLRCDQDKTEESKIVTQRSESYLTL